MTAREKTLKELLAPRVLVRRVARLFRQPIFIALTLFGHAYLLFGTFALYWLESGENPHVHSLLDTLFWSVATVTTVGYGSVVPVTTGGKILGIAMMIMGSLLFWSYTALFAGAIVAPELRMVEEEVHDIERSLKNRRPD